MAQLMPIDTWGRPETLQRHFREHGAEVGATSASDYAAQAAEFFQKGIREGLPIKIDSQGIIRIYDEVTNTFGAYNPSGTTATFFKPTGGINYWNTQPGSSPWFG